MEGISSMHCFLFKFTVHINSVLLFWKLLVFEFLFGPLKTLLSSMSAPQVRIVPLLDALQLLTLFAGTLTYLEPKLYLLIVFYSGPCITLKHQSYATCMYTYVRVCILPRRIMA
jgi:hypothetical protein